MSDEELNQLDLRHHHEEMDLKGRHTEEQSKLWLDHHAQIMGATQGQREAPADMVAKFAKDNVALVKKHEKEIEQLEKKQALEKERAMAPQKAAPEEKATSQEKTATPEKAASQEKLTPEEQEMVNRLQKMQELQDEKNRMLENSKKKEKDDFEL